MASDSQRRANRANAKASTGPRTAAGKTRAARNALRHGFNVPVASDLELAPDIEALAQKIAGEGASKPLLDLAHRIAEANIDLRRVRAHRLQLFGDLHDESDYEPLKARIRRFRFARTYVRRCDPTAWVPPDILAAMQSKILEGPEKLATILEEVAGQLAVFDRYERRALSRRKFAIRHFDAARAPKFAP